MTSKTNYRWVIRVNLGSSTHVKFTPQKTQNTPPTTTELWVCLKRSSYGNTRVGTGTVRTFGPSRRGWNPEIFKSEISLIATLTSFHRKRFQPVFAWSKQTVSFQLEWSRKQLWRGALKPHPPHSHYPHLPKRGWTDSESGRYYEVSVDAAVVAVLPELDELSCLKVAQQAVLTILLVHLECDCVSNHQASLLQTAPTVSSPDGYEK